MKSEFVACVLAVQEIVQLKKFFEHLSTPKNSKDPMTLYCDSQEAILYTNDPKYLSKTKDIGIKQNFTRDVVASGEIILRCIPICEIIFDNFTKVISRDLFEIHVKAHDLHRV